MKLVPMITSRSLQTDEVLLTLKKAESGKLKKENRLLKAASGNRKDYRFATWWREANHGAVFQLAQKAARIPRPSDSG